MDLNALPEEDEENFEQHHYRAPQDRFESGADIARREREERRKRLRRENDRPVNVSKPSNDQYYLTTNAKSYDRNGIPPGWIDCPSYGQEIHGIIPSKVPLSEQYNDRVPPGKRYSFKQVFKVFGRKLGLVIDLTNTSRYYPTIDLKKEGIKHYKIQCRGRDEVPDNVSVNKFVYEVTQFFNHQKHSKKHILVHCTHGHNRTGYMIVHYLLRSQPYMSVTQAIKIFAEAKPPGIYKPDYIEALYTFYHERKPETTICPPTPEWKRSSELDLNGEALPDDDDDGAPAAPPQETEYANAAITNDDILGDEIPQDQLELFRRFCYQMLKLNVGGRGMSQFPGSHPVSLNSENLQLLRQRYYYSTWKADGTRYMMLITLDGCYLIDRTFTFRRVQMRFPCRQTADGFSMHHFTLLDGEMVIDTLPDSHKKERRYLIYDLMAINGISVTERPFNERWKMVEKEVVEPRNQERQYIYQSRNPHYRFDLEPFRVRRKDFWLLSTVNKLLNEFIPKLSHEADGLIFQGWDDPYVPRTHEGLLKWKYANMNSVDFLFEMSNDERQMLYLYERGKKKPMEGNAVFFEDNSDPSLYSGKIIECSWDADKQSWSCMRIRADKSTPNEFNTYRKVMRSIKDNITEDVLMNEIYEIIRLPMYADRIQSDTKARQHANSGRRR